MPINKHEIGTRAAETTTAFNPVVGAQFSELIKSAGHVAGQAARHPVTVGRHLLGFLNDTSRIIRGKSDLKPHSRDRRFTDPTWTTNPFYQRSLQFWMAARASVTGCIEDFELDRTDRARTALLADIVMDSLAPTNTLLGNPAAVKRFYETGGRSLLRGMRNAYDDFISGNSLPAQVDSRKFEVGNNLANTEGSVVFRNDMLELIQYAPLTEKVHSIPLLIIPPQINKFYVLDLTPEKSMIRYLVSQGFRVFCISWFNPGPAQESWSLDRYVKAVIKATDVVRDITRQRKLNVTSACSGGITISTTMSHLAAIGDDRINSCTLQVCLLDPKPDDTELGALMTEASIEYARSKSAKKGILSGKELATTFAWMRPNDLIWNYFVNNYLMGEKPPAFDILHWNNDSTNLAAAVHSDFLDFFVDSPFARPGTQKLAGQPLDLTKVKQDIFISSGLTDHITPWRACYRSVGLFGGDVTFIVSSSGHIQSLINPPGNPKSRYLTSSARTGDATEWMDHAEEHNGSWWSMWNDWLGDHSGARRNAPRKLGNASYPPLDKAPGLYVFG
jgi:polyhydroxyalkanoate synthase